MTFLVTSQTVQKSFGKIQLIFSLAHCGVLFSQALKAQSSFQTITSYLINDEPIEIYKGEIPDAFKGSIKFSNVSFSYPLRDEKTVLQNVTLDIEPGKVVAFCGYSGSGKSTIAAVKLKFKYSI